MATIQVLNRQIAELIAAGEVVERPSSVVKELMENTIDAGARHVTVEIRDGGVTYIRITDDGCGIPREDVPTAFLRHATSKIRTKEDLDTIGTLGFRGEALASIAAVSRVELVTCAKGELEGTRYVIHGGEEMALEDAGCPEGATFIVQDLFYNVPARMKFLKKDVGEGNAVAGIVERLALSHPEIAVRFIRNGRTEMQTPGDGNLLNTIHAVFGKHFSSTLLPVEYTMGGVHVSGFVCKPEGCRPNRTMQHFFVNARYVKTQTAMVALERAYKGVMMVGRFPTCVLFVDLPEETVDVNVHPAKIEVRFVNEKPVFDAVYYGVRSALESREEAFRRVLLQDEKPHLTVAQKPVSAPQAVPPKPSVNTAPSVKPAFLRPTPPVPSTRAYLDIQVEHDRPVEMALQDGTDKPISLGQSVCVAEPPVSILPVPPEKPEVQEEMAPPVVMQTPMDTQPAIRLVGQLFHTYILAEKVESLFVIDKHAAHERILYNQLKAQATVDEQPLLTPVTVTVSREEHTALLSAVKELKQAGIELEDFGGLCVVVRSFPLILAGVDIDSTIREIAAGLIGGSREVQSARLDWIYHSTACRAAIKAGDTSQPDELLELARRVLLEDDIRYCPHGRPVCIEMTRKQLEKQFGRIQ